MEGKKLLRLSVECFKSLRSKFPYRVTWSPEFAAWERFLAEQVGEKALDVRRIVMSLKPIRVTS